MFRSSTQRNPRSKGLKVKHALQVCVLLGVFVWLIYQVGHSREKGASYGDNTKTGSEVVKLGRKDLHHHREEENEEESKSEEQNKMDDVNGADDETLKQKHEQNNSDVDSEHKQNPVDQEIEEGSKNAMIEKESEEHNQNSREDNDNMTNKETKENKNEVEKKEGREISDEKSQQENEEMRETKTENMENEETNKNKTKTKNTEENHEQDSKEDKESNATENGRKTNEKIQEVVSSEDRVRDGERNNEEAREEHYAGDNPSRALDLKSQETSDGSLNKTDQFDKTEKNESALESQTTGTEVTNTAVTTNHGNGSENQDEAQNDTKNNYVSESSEHEQKQNNLSEDGIETFHLQNGTHTTSNNTGKQIETSENSNSKVDDSSLHNTMPKADNPNSDVAWEPANSTLTDSSGAHESEVTSREYKDTSSHSAQSEITNNNSIQEGIPEQVWSSNTNGNRGASQVVQLTSSNTSSELKENESSEFENSIGFGQNDNISYVQSNIKSDGSANHKTDARPDQVNSLDTSPEQNTEGSPNSGNSNDAGQNNSNHNANANDSHDVPVNASDSSIPEEKDAYSKNNIDLEQVENESTAQSKSEKEEREL